MKRKRCYNCKVGTPTLMSKRRVSYSLNSKRTKRPPTRGRQRVTRSNNLLSNLPRRPSKRSNPNAAYNNALYRISVIGAKQKARRARNKRILSKTAAAVGFRRHRTKTLAGMLREKYSARKIARTFKKYSPATKAKAATKLAATYRMYSTQNAADIMGRRNAGRKILAAMRANTWNNKFKRQSARVITRALRRNVTRARAVTTTASALGSEVPTLATTVPVASTIYDSVPNIQDEADDGWVDDAEDDEFFDTVQPGNTVSFQLGTTPGPNVRQNPTLSMAERMTGEMSDTITTPREHIFNEYARRYGILKRKWLTHRGERKRRELLKDLNRLNLLVRSSSQTFQIKYVPFDFNQEMDIAEEPSQLQGSPTTGQTATVVSDSEDMISDIIP